MKILIPTCKAEPSIIDELRRVSPETNIIVNSSNNCAAFNRNRTLEQVEIGELVVMMDDDMTGFFPNWLDRFVEPFTKFKDVVMVSARLLRPDDRPGIMVGDNYDVETTYVVVEKRRLPTACIAFVYDGTTFDESFVGSGFEDDDFCKRLSIKYPNGLFVINNRVRLIHKNEMKQQGGRNWELNRRYYLKKWPDEDNRWNVGSLE
jgi:hypothetical protein